MTDFLWDTGTNGFIAAPLDLMTIELNALASGAAATSLVGGSTGVFTQTSTASAILGEAQFNSGGSFTPVAGQALLAWFLKSLDGGATFEALVATPSITVPALPRPPDFVIPLDNAALASGNKKFAIGPFRIFPGSWKLVLQNTAPSTATALPAVSNKITIAPPAWKY